jgi:amidase
MKCSRRVVFSWLPVALVSLTFCSGCSFLPRPNRLSGNRAFIDYWAPDPNSTQLRLAVKDNIDMKGKVTTAGSEIFSVTHKPAEKDAPCLAIARRRKVQIVGKTNMTEFAVSPSGMNEYFGTAVNPLNRRLIPGGSSSGSAVAVAHGMADVAFGTDTAGSIRVPAACCGIVGLKTTYGLVSIEGVYPVEPKHLDTVGPMGIDIARTVQGMELLQESFASKYAAAKAAKPTAGSIRVGRLKLKGTDPKIDNAIDDALARTGFQVVQLDESFREKWESAKRDGNTIAATGAWMTNQRFQFALGVTARTQSAIRLGQITSTGYEGALARRTEWQQALRQVFEKVDLIALPTLQRRPPGLPLINLRIGILEAQMLQVQNTVPVNFAGNPALAMPVPLRGGKGARTLSGAMSAKTPLTSLQLIGPRLAEADLLNAGRLIENAVEQ